MQGCRGEGDGDGESVERQKESKANDEVLSTEDIECVAEFMGAVGVYLLPL